MMTNYYYNESKNSIVIATNFEYDVIPNGFKKITKEEFEELQKTLNQPGMNTDGVPMVEYNEEN